MASAYKFRMAGMEAELPATTAHQAPVPRTGTSEKAGIRRRRVDAQPRSAFFPSGEHASGARNSEGASDARAPTTSPVVATSSTSWRVPGGLTGQLPTRFKFPPVRSVLWDRTPLGEKVVLGWSQCRKLLAFTPGALECMHSFLVARRPSRTHEFAPSQFAVRSLAVRRGAFGRVLTLIVDQPSDTRSGASTVSVHWGGELPTFVRGPSASERLSEDAGCDHMSTLDAVKAHKRHQVDLSPSPEAWVESTRAVAHATAQRGLATHAQQLQQTHIGASVGSEDRLCLHAETVYPGASFEFTPIGKLQLSASCLSDTLRAPVATLHTNSGSDKIEFGFLTLDQFRKAVPLVATDSLVYRVPLVGLWVKPSSAAATLGAVLDHPDTWAACLRFLNCAGVAERVFVDSGTFLLAAFVPSAPSGGLEQDSFVAPWVQPFDPHFLECRCVVDGAAGPQPSTNGLDVMGHQSATLMLKVKPDAAGTANFVRTFNAAGIRVSKSRLGVSTVGFLEGHTGRGSGGARHLRRSSPGSGAMSHSGSPGGDASRQDVVFTQFQDVEVDGDGVARFGPRMPGSPANAVAIERALMGANAHVARVRRQRVRDATAEVMGTPQQQPGTPPSDRRRVGAMSDPEGPAPRPRPATTLPSPAPSSPLVSDPRAGEAGDSWGSASSGMRRLRRSAQLGADATPTRLFTESGEPGPGASPSSASDARRSGADASRPDAVAARHGRSPRSRIPQPQRRALGVAAQRKQRARSKERVGSRSGVVRGPLPASPTTRGGQSATTTPTTTTPRRGGCSTQHSEGSTAVLIAKFEALGVDHAFAVLLAEQQQQLALLQAQLAQLQSPASSSHGTPQTSLPATPSPPPSQPAAASPPVAVSAVPGSVTAVASQASARPVDASTPLLTAVSVAPPAAVAGASVATPVTLYMGSGSSPACVVNAPTPAPAPPVAVLAADPAPAAFAAASAGADTLALVPVAALPEQRPRTAAERLQCAESRYPVRLEGWGGDRWNGRSFTDCAARSEVDDDGGSDSDGGVADVFDAPLAEPSDLERLIRDGERTVRPLPAVQAGRAAASVRGTVVSGLGYGADDETSIAAPPLPRLSLVYDRPLSDGSSYCGSVSSVSDPGRDDASDVSASDTLSLPQRADLVPSDRMDPPVVPLEPHPAPGRPPSPCSDLSSEDELLRAHMALPSAEPRSDRATPTAAPVRAVTNVSASSHQNEAFGGLDGGVPTILFDEGLLGELCSDDETDDGGNWRPQWRGSDTDGDMDSEGGVEPEYEAGHQRTSVLDRICAKYLS